MGSDDALLSLEGVKIFQGGFKLQDFNISSLYYISKGHSSQAVYLSCFRKVKSLDTEVFIDDSVSGPNGYPFCLCSQWAL